MRKNTALRQTIVDCVVKHGGVADTAQMRAAAIDAKVTDGLRYLDKYAQSLADAGVLRRISKGRYGHIETLNDGTHGIFARIPYGEHLYGRILHCMLTRRFVSTTQVRRALRSGGEDVPPGKVYDAMNQLKDNGYIKSVGVKTYTLSRRTLSAVGLSDVIAPPGEYQGTLRERLLPHVRALLQTEPPKHVHAIHAQLKDRGFEADLRDVHRVIHSLARHEPVRRVETATYTLLPAITAA